MASPLARRFGLVQATALNMIAMIGVSPFITIPPADDGDRWPASDSARVRRAIGWIFIFATTGVAVALFGVEVLVAGIICLPTWPACTGGWPFGQGVVA